MKKLLAAIIILLFAHGLTAFSQIPESMDQDAPRKNAPIKTPSGKLDVVQSLPHRISYQGLLTTGSGLPVADGNYSLRFDFYDSLSGGTSAWSETFSNVPVARGTFNVILDTVNLPFTEQYYLQVTATGGPSGPSYPLTFSPRSTFTSAP